MLGKSCRAQHVTTCLEDVDGIHDPASASAYTCYSCAVSSSQSPQQDQKMTHHRATVYAKQHCFRQLQPWMPTLASATSRMTLLAIAAVYTRVNYPAQGPNKLLCVGSTQTPCCTIIAPYNQIRHVQTPSYIENSLWTTACSQWLQYYATGSYTN